MNEDNRNYILFAVTMTVAAMLLLLVSEPVRCTGPTIAQLSSDQ